MDASQGVVARHLMMRRIKVDLRFGRLAEAAVTPTNLDVTSDGVLRGPRARFVRRCPPDLRLATVLRLDLEVSEAKALTPIPRCVDP